MDLIQSFLLDVGEWFSDDRVKTGAGVVGGAVLATVVGWFRKRKPDRVKVSVDAPAGEKVYIQLGEDDKEEDNRNPAAVLPRYTRGLE